MYVEGQAWDDVSLKGDCKGSQDLIDYAKLHRTKLLVNKASSKHRTPFLLVWATL